MAVDPGNEWFVTGSADRTMKIWDLATGQLKLTLTGHIEQVTPPPLLPPGSIPSSFIIDLNCLPGLSPNLVFNFPTHARTGPRQVASHRATKQGRQAAVEPCSRPLQCWLIRVPVHSSVQVSQMDLHCSSPSAGARQVTRPKNCHAPKTRTKAAENRQLGVVERD